jgi:hypothetical protein
MNIQDALFLSVLCVTRNLFSYHTVGIQDKDICKEDSESIYKE